MGECALVILDVIGGGALAIAVVTVLWQRRCSTQRREVVKECSPYNAEWQGPQSA